MASIAWQLCQSCKLPTESETWGLGPIICAYQSAVKSSSCSNLRSHGTEEGKCDKKAGEPVGSLGIFPAVGLTGDP